MTFYETPQKICLNIIISMNYPIARINYSPCVRYYDIRILFSDAIDSLPHYLYLTLHNAFPHYIVLEQIESIWEINKATLYISYRIEYILQICQYFFRRHKSSFLSG